MEDYEEDYEDLAEEDSDEQSFVCEDCDHKWEEDEDNTSVGFSVCPMCGSSNTLDITQ